MQQKAFLNFGFILCVVLFAQYAMADIQPAGIVIYTGESGSSADGFAQSSEFQSIEKHPWGVLVRVIKGPDLRVTSGAIKKVIMYPDLTSLTVIDDASANDLIERRNFFAEISKKFPSSRPYLERFTTRCDSSINTYKAGNVILSGQIKSREEYVFMLKKDERGLNPIPSIVIGGKNFQNVQSASLKDGKLKIYHEGGFANFNIADVPPPILKQLQVKFGLQADQPNVELVSTAKSSSSSSTAVEAVKKKLETLSLPAVKFEQATLDEAIEYFRNKSKMLDTSSQPSAAGVNFFLKPGATSPNTVFSLELKQLPLMEALRKVADLTNCDFEVTESGVIIIPR